MMENGTAMVPKFSVMEAEARMGFEVLKNLIPILKENKVAKVEIFYSGSGDEGSINSIEFFDKEDISIEPFTKHREVTSTCEACGQLMPFRPDCKVSEQLEDAAYTILQGEYPGWEIECGSSGAIFLHVESGEISISNGLFGYYDSKDFQL